MVEAEFDPGRIVYIVESMDHTFLKQPVQEETKDLHLGSEVQITTIMDLEQPERQV